MKELQEQLEMYGVSTLSTAELLAFILSSETSQRDLVSLVCALLDTYGVRGLQNVDLTELSSKSGLTRAQAVRLKVVCELAQRSMLSESEVSPQGRFVHESVQRLHPLKKTQGRHRKLFFHHVGLVGSVDFEKTVFHSVRLSLIIDALAASPDRDRVIADLRSVFPSERCNCWGVPDKAWRVFGRVSAEDVVLLVRTIRLGGDIPALCPVAYPLPGRQPDLSSALWGDSKYPLVFCFQTEQLALPWSDFFRHMGYEEGFDPHGCFYSAADWRVEKQGGLDAYLHRLRSDYTPRALPLSPPEELARVGGIPLRRVANVLRLEAF